MSLVVSNFTASSALERRPAALIRGASIKLTVPVVTTFPFIPAASLSAAIPGLFSSDNNFNPSLTKNRFSPVRGATSAMTPRATRSR